MKNPWQFAFEAKNEELTEKEIQDILDIEGRQNYYRRESIMDILMSLTHGQVDMEMFEEA